jgi:O-methyltransferase
MSNQIDDLTHVMCNTSYGKNIYYLSDPHANIKRYNLILFANMVKHNNCEGAICEFGLFNGYTFSLLIDLFGKNVKYCGYDSFEGLSQPVIEDNLSYYGCIQGNMKRPIDVVTNHLQIFNNISEYDVNLYKGWVSDTVPINLPEKIAFAHVDVDLYEPTNHILENIIPRMSKGGIIIIDDYMDNNWKGIESSAKYIEEKFNVKIYPLNLDNNENTLYKVYQGYILF